MAETSNLGAAFDAALKQVDQALAADLRTQGGASARAELTRLRSELESERTAALQRGAVDPEWVRRVVREVAAWTQETELSLIAALGRIARASAQPPAV